MGAPKGASMILERFLLTDQVAVVTGAGRGIGAASAIALAEAGADVVISARTEADLDGVAVAVEALGRRAEVVAGDLSDFEVVASLARRAKERFGRLDVVVNNLGGTMPLPLLDTTPEYLEEAFHFNVATAHALVRAAVPLLLEGGGGSIVNISSVMGRITGRASSHTHGQGGPRPLHPPRGEGPRPRIRINAIAVGSTATSALDIVLQSDELREQMEAATPLGASATSRTSQPACSSWRRPPAGT